ncbi:NfeD family protein [Sphingomonas sp. SUN039]|uniref:NfeD family protein n=1 Tax=Sphingomonas sp. SUN039 TaxID=2937787 RepID=UPI002164C88D|nr:NfeD family protein [Sphingomonas sp. SUN039]UVO53320.1 NfeD family protein [Sphingomonas sp. SUN039]
MNGPFGLADHWLWMIAGALLGIAEMLLPGVFLIWIGAAAVLTGVLALLLPIGAIPQFLIFAVASVAAIYAGRKYLTHNPIVSADPLLNDKSARLVGSIVTAVEPVDALSGRVKVGDGVWSARGAEAAVGDRLRVTGCDGAVLVVERA